MIMRVQGKLQNWPIQRKLLLIIFSTIAASLILVLAGIVVYEISTYRSRQAQEMTSLAGFIAVNSAPPHSIPKNHVYSHPMSVQVNDCRLRSNLVLKETGSWGGTWNWCVP